MGIYEDSEETSVFFYCYCVDDVGDVGAANVVAGARGEGLFLNVMKKCAKQLLDVGDDGER